MGNLVPIYKIPIYVRHILFVIFVGSLWMIYLLILPAPKIKLVNKLKLQRIIIAMDHTPRAVRPSRPLSI